MGRGRAALGAALALSVLAHLWLTDRAEDWWSGAGEAPPLAIRASLGLAPPPPPPPPPTASREPATPVRAEAAPLAPPPAAPEEPVAPPLGPAPAAVEAPPAPPPSTVVAMAPSVPALAPEPSLPSFPGRALPERLTLVFNVRAGEGMQLGQATYTWQTGAGRYQLRSVAEASGLAALFVSGRIVQASEGRIGPGGLRPEQFWMTRKEKRKEWARFEWQQGRLVLPGGDVSLEARTQDLLSFPFHLALTVTEDAGEWVLPVTNGKKLRDYRFALLGRSTLEVGDEALAVLHVRGTRAGEGHLDVWLAPERHWLPARIRTEDQKGKATELTLVRLALE